LHNSSPEKSRLSERWPHFFGEAAGSRQVRLTVAGDEINCQFIAKQVWGDVIDCRTGARSSAGRLPGAGRYVSLLQEMKLTVSSLQNRFGGM